MKEQLFNVNVALTVLAAFADDMVLFTDSQHEMQRCLFTFNSSTEQAEF